MANQERQSILCPNCRKLISVDESPCPYCGLRNPGSRWKNNFLTKGILEGDLVRQITIVCVVMFILSILVSRTATRISLNPFGFLSPSNRALILLGATGTIPIDTFHRWWTLLTANYLHGGLLHILFNMIALRQIAPLTVQEYGTYRTFSIFTISGVGGFLLTYLRGTPLTLGASAALCGIIGAALYYGKSRGGYFGQALYQQLIGWVIGIFAFGFFVPGIDNWAHGGGLVCGIATGFLLGYSERTPENMFHKMLAAVCVLATLAALTWAVILTFAISFGA